MTNDDRQGPGRERPFGDHELDELLGVYALDAVSDEERRAVEEYLLVNPRARQEVEEHREVASMLAWSGTTAPEGLWDRIAATLEDTAPAPSGELAAVLALGDARAAADGRTSARTRRQRRTMAASWVASAAAAAAVAVVVVKVLDEDAVTQDAAPIEAALADARAAGTSRVASLVSADGRLGGEVVIDDEGHGFLVADALPVLPEDRTWQLWGVVDGEAISLGILGHAPRIELFTVDGPVSELIVTNEQHGGVVSNGNLEGSYGGSLG
jgi:anti-sigma-K factor RskA